MNTKDLVDLSFTRTLHRSVNEKKAVIKEQASNSLQPQHTRIIVTEEIAINNAPNLRIGGFLTEK